jgi:hypothetical protein
MRIAPCALLALVLLSPASPGAVRVSRLDAVQAAVEERLAGELPEPRRPRRDLLRAGEVLAAPRVSLLDDLTSGRTVLRLLDRSFDGEFEPDLGDALEALDADVRFERDALSGWVGHAGGAAKDARVQAGVDAADRRLDRADAAAVRCERARLLRLAGLALSRARSEAAFRAPDVDPAPYAGTAPDFALPDVTPDSATFGTDVSPSDQAGFVTAWYYTRLT